MRICQLQSGKPSHGISIPVLATFTISSAFRSVIPVLLRQLLVFALVVTVQSTHESPLPCISDPTPLDEGASRAVTALLILLNRRFQRSFSRVQQRLSRWTKPTSNSLFVGTLNDLARTRAELVAENALLRQQLVILHRQVKRSVYPDRSAAPGRARASRQELDTGAVDCAAQYPPRLASSGISLVLETAIEASLEEPQNRYQDHRVDPNDGAEQSLVGR